MVMKFQLAVLVSLFFLLPVSVSAQQYQPTRTLDQLKFDEAQVQDLFSLFLSRAPYMLDESSDTEQMVRELAPQALEILRPDQRRILQDMQELVPTEELQSFQTMSRKERKRFVFDSAKGFDHPSKQEWLDRIEEMTE